MYLGGRHAVIEFRIKAKVDSGLYISGSKVICKALRFMGRRNIADSPTRTNQAGSATLKKVQQQKFILHY